MAKKKLNMSDDEIIALINPMRDETELWQSDLSQKRQDSYALYRFQVPEATREGFSKVVDATAYQVIESVKPNISAIFTGDWFNLTSTDQKRAENLKKLVRHFMFVKQNGKQKVRDSTHDALINYFCILKNYHKIDYDVETLNFDSLNEQQFMALSQEPDVIVSKYTEVVEETQAETMIDGMGMPIWSPPVRTFEKVKALKKNIKYAGPWTDVVPAWEFYYTPGYSCLADCPLIMHRVKRTLDYVRKMERMGEYKKGSYEKVKDTYSTALEDTTVAGEIVQKFEVEDLGAPEWMTDRGSQKEIQSNNEVWVDECWLRMDIDKDGFLEPCKVVIIGDTVVCDPVENPYGKPPFALGYVNKEAHKMESIPLPLLLEHEQKEMTNLRRILVDSAAEACYHSMITDDPVLQRQWSERYIGDALKGRPGSFEVKQAPSPSMFPLRLYEKQQEAVERKTGVTSYSQGLDNNALNKTATGVNLIMGASQMRMRYMAEQLSDLWEETVRQYIYILQKWPPMDMPLILEGQQIQINPEDLRGDYEIEVDIGVGPQEKAQAAMHMDETLKFLMQAGVPMGIATPGHVAKAFHEKMKLLNIPSGDFLLPDAEIERRMQLAEANKNFMGKLTGKVQQMAQQGVPPEIAGQQILNDVIAMGGMNGGGQNGGPNQQGQPGAVVPQAQGRAQGN